MEDMRKKLFKDIGDRYITACVYADQDGIISGIDKAKKRAEEIGLSVAFAVEEGDSVLAEDIVMQITGDPYQIAYAEENFIGMMAKASGVATAARAFVNAADGKVRIVCGAWKKMPAEIKNELRQAITTGGADCRITNEPMVYLDKNYVDMFGGIPAALSAAGTFDGRQKCIQICGRYEDGDMAREALLATQCGADIIYVDTGRIVDIAYVADTVRPILDTWEQEMGYRKVQLAYGGGVTLSILPQLTEVGVDIIGVGRGIIDAPLLDMHLEITHSERTEFHHANYDLMGKSELLIEGITLHQGNLNDLAKIVAKIIEVEEQEVLVIDVRNETVALDVLRNQINAFSIVGKEQLILDSIAKLDGVSLSADARITSNGMLGWIAVDTDEMTTDLQSGHDMMKDVLDKISKRVIVFASGPEVENGEIEDTNSPMIMQRFEKEGYDVTRGPVLKDDVVLFTGKLRDAISHGYGVIITTGGVGAEDKDHSVEAIQCLDHKAAAPYIVKFETGHGRHKKDGIRIGVGQCDSALLIALPGPNDEVSACLETVVQGVKEGWSKEILASKVAKLLRKRLREKTMLHQHTKHHE